MAVCTKDLYAVLSAVWGVMTLIGILLKWQGWTNFFLLEMIAIPWFIVPIFGLIEEKLQQFDEQHRVKTMNILMIEDNESVSEMMQMFFE